MNEPQSIDEILDRLQLQAIGRSEHLTNPMVYQLDIKEAKAAIEAMVGEIIGQDEADLPKGILDNYWSYPSIRNREKSEQRLRASKYNLRLEKE